MNTTTHTDGCDILRCQNHCLHREHHKTKVPTEETTDAMCCAAPVPAEKEDIRMNDNCAEMINQQNTAGEYLQPGWGACKPETEQWFESERTKHAAAIHSNKKDGAQLDTTWRSGL